MLKVSLRSLLANKGRFAMTTFAVVLGVAFVVGAFVVTDTVRVSVEGLFTEIGGGVDVTVRASTEIESGGGGGPTSRGKIDEQLLPVVQGTDGVRSAEGTAGGYAQMLTPDGEPVTTTGAPFLGVSWGEDDSLYPVTLDEGRKPSGAERGGGRPRHGRGVRPDTGDAFDGAVERGAASGRGGRGVHLR
jgi:putative ABC transport system permease protein